MPLAAAHARRAPCRRSLPTPVSARTASRLAGPIARVHELQHVLGNRATGRVLRTAVSDTASSPSSVAGGDDRDLQSDRFAGDPVLEACLDGKRVLRAGDSGEAVVKIQQALIDAGIPLPAFGADGKFGSETKTGVRSFQAESGLTGNALDGIVGPTTMGLLDARFAGAAPQPGACQNGSVDATIDPLPAVPPFEFTTMSAPQVLEEVKRMQPAGAPIPQDPPLGASQPTFPVNAVKVTTEGAENSPCRKCVADWDVSAAFRVLIATGSFSDEPRRFAAIQQGDESGCPSLPLAQLLEVRKAILPEAVPFIVAGEFEHYLDFVIAFRMAAGRYLANVRRLTSQRSHIFGQDQADCEDKVERFLMEMAGHPIFIKGAFLKLYTAVFADDFTEMFNSPNRDGSKDHDAFCRPPKGQKPIFPNIDLDKNPFGCTAFARKFDRRSFPGIPGRPSAAAVVDGNEPPKRPWHAL